jgi:hypothetical protein
MWLRCFYSGAFKSSKLLAFKSSKLLGDHTFAWTAPTLNMVGFEVSQEFRIQPGLDQSLT